MILAEDLPAREKALKKLVKSASKGGGILDALADLKEKAEESLSSARKTEMEACAECRT